MKALTTFTAIAALIAGVSIASAAGQMDKNGSMGSSSMSKSTAKITGSGKFCNKTSSGELNCQFASMDACQKASGSQQAGANNCVAHPGTGTTGAK